MLCRQADKKINLLQKKKTNCQTVNELLNYFFRTGCSQQMYDQSLYQYYELFKRYIQLVEQLLPCRLWTTSTGGGRIHCVLDCYGSVVRFTGFFVTDFQRLFHSQSRRLSFVRISCQNDSPMGGRPGTMSFPFPRDTNLVYR